MRLLGYTNHDVCLVLACYPAPKKMLPIPRLREVHKGKLNAMGFTGLLLLQNAAGT